MRRGDGRGHYGAAVPFSFTDGDVAVRADIGDLFHREWQRLSGPGCWWSGAERVALARAARRARAGEPEAATEVPTAAVEAAAAIFTEPAQIRDEWVADIAAEIGYAPYVEIVGVVSRLSAVDGFHRAMGLQAPPLPQPRPGSPPGAEDERAGRGPAWVPMVGGASIVHALSLVPDEAAAQEDMHGPLYLTYEGMSDLKHAAGLTRAQMELVAARTSAVNECFY